MTRLLSGLILAASLSAQDELTTLDGASVRGSIQSLQDGQLVLASDDGEARVALDQLTDVRFEADDSIDALGWLGSASFSTRSGTQLAADFDGVNERGQAVFRLVAEPGPQPIGQVAVPLSQLRSMRLMPADATVEGFERALANPPRTSDALFALNRRTNKIDRLSVQVLGFDGTDKLQVEFGAKVTSLQLSQVYGVVFGAENGAAPPAQPNPNVLVELLGDHPRLRGKLVEIDPATLSLKLDEGSILKLPRIRVAGFAVQSGRVAYLSDLDPSEVEQTAAFDFTRPWLRDRTPQGDGLELGGRSFRRGLCLIPRTRLTYALTPGQFGVFEATIGMDSRSSPQAHATFRIELDGASIFDSDPMTLETAPHQLRIDLGNAKTLTIATDFGKNFDLGDHCVFANARLVKD